jgi:hypothetical protein
MVPPPDPVTKMRVFSGDAGLCLHAPQKLQHLLRLTRLVALIVLPDRLVGRGIHDDRFHRGRAHIQANEKCLHHHSLSYRRLLRDKKTRRRTSANASRAGSGWFDGSRGCAPRRDGLQRAIECRRQKCQRHHH